MTQTQKPRQQPSEVTIRHLAYELREMNKTLAKLESRKVGKSSTAIVVILAGIATAVLAFAGDVPASAAVGGLIAAYGLLALFD